jgi:hypothetical protein
MSRRTRSEPMRRLARTLIGVLACGAVAGIVTACSGAVSVASGQRREASTLIGRSAPANWLTATLPGGGAVLAYPPSMRLLSGDPGAVTAGEVSRSGRYLLYLNVTPRQGDETLADWAGFRLDHQREEEITSVRKLSEQTGVRFLGAKGTCVTDAYVTKVDAHHFTEIACFVRGRTSADVIVAAAPTANWTSAAGLLRRAITGFVVR